MARRKKKKLEAHLWEAVSESSTADGRSVNRVNVGRYPYRWRCRCMKCRAVKVVVRHSAREYTEELVAGGTKWVARCFGNEKLAGPAFIHTAAREIVVEEGE